MFIGFRIKRIRIVWNIFGLLHIQNRIPNSNTKFIQWQNTVLCTIILWCKYLKQCDLEVNLVEVFKGSIFFGDLKLFNFCLRSICFHLIIYSSPPIYLIYLCTLNLDKHVPSCFEYSFKLLDFLRWMSEKQEVHNRVLHHLYRPQITTNKQQHEQYWSKNRILRYPLLAVGSR